MEIHRQPEQQAIDERARLLAPTENLRDQIQLGIDQAESGNVLDHETVFGQLRAMAAEGSK